MISHEIMMINCIIKENDMKLLITLYMFDYITYGNFRSILSFEAQFIIKYALSI